MIDLLASNSFARIAFLALIFGAVLMIVLSLSRMASRRADVKSELKALSEVQAGPNGMRLQEQRDSAWSRLAERIEKSGLSLTDTKGDALKDKLATAGYDAPSAPKIFTLVRLVLVFALPLAYLLIATSGSGTVSYGKLYLYGAILAALGLYLPNLYVSAKANRRMEAITNGFPDCLDLMLVCVEAGLGLEAAMDRVGREMVSSHPRVAELLSMATLQLRGGATREEALRKMGEKSAVDEIKSFAVLLIQSDKLGTSIADTLRVYAAEMRDKRRMRAEEKAHRLPVLISIPLVVCMLPTMIGVLMMPGVVRVIRELIPALGGGS